MLTSPSVAEADFLVVTFCLEDVVPNASFCCLDNDFPRGRGRGLPRGSTQSIDEGDYEYCNFFQFNVSRGVLDPGGAF